MSNILSILLSFAILSQNFGIHANDIAQLDEFIEHAAYHSEQYGDNIFVFISKHYGELKTAHEKEHKEEKEDHEQLPFQHQSQVIASTAFIINLEFAAFKTTEFSEFKIHNFHYQASSSSCYLDGLFQPPRHS
mgnify:CR=1 FL=1